MKYKVFLKEDFKRFEAFVFLNFLKLNNLSLKFNEKGCFVELQNDGVIETETPLIETDGVILQEIS